MAADSQVIIVTSTGFLDPALSSPDGVFPGLAEPEPPPLLPPQAASRLENNSKAMIPLAHFLTPCLIERPPQW